MTKVGSIVFGPVLTPNKDSASGYKLQMQSVTCQQPYAQACNCIGPQPGQTKCPCALVREAEMGRRMIDEGIIVNGQRYKLVPVEEPS